MAIFTPGPAVGQISGRVGGSVFSHNRGGMYVRNGTIPTKSTTPFAEAAKQRLSRASQGFALLTSEIREAWNNYATQNPIINRLGRPITLSAHGAFVQLNINSFLAGGPGLAIPPIVGPPAGLSSITPTYDIGAGFFGVAFAPDPLDTNEHLSIEMAIVDNPGVNYVNNLFKQVLVAGAATVSPVDTKAAARSRFGTLIVGQKVFYRVSTIDSVTGLRSQPFVANGVIVST